MILNPGECVYAKYEYLTVPGTVPEDWEASVDEGATWHTMVEVDGCLGILVAHTDYAGGSSDALVLPQNTTSVWLRLVDTPETIVETGFVILCRSS